MKIEYFEDYQVMSQAAGKFIYNQLAANPELLMCTASGNSPLKSYQVLVDYCISKPISTDKLKILKLDEWGGIPLENPETCDSFLMDHLISPLQISSDRYISFDSQSADPISECDRVKKWLVTRGPIDLCVLGIGRNGHLGFNEPSDHLMPFAHVSTLSESSLQHSMVRKMQAKPSYGLTLGMTEILQSKKILMLISGKGKKAIIKKFLSGKITTNLPASFLWLHPDVICLFDSMGLDNGVSIKKIVNN